MRFLVFASLLLSLNTWAGLALGTYNIRNFDYDERYRIRTDKPALERILKSLRFDLLGVNEINNVVEFERFVSQKLPGFDTQLTSCGGAGGQMLGFIFDTRKVKLLSFHEEMSVTDPTGRNPGCTSGLRPLAVALFEEISTGERFYAIQAHLKAGGNADDMRRRFRQYEILESLVKDLRSKGHKQIVVSGDFNSTGYLQKAEDFRKLNSMIANAGLVHLSADLKCSAYWWGGTNDGYETPSLLDHIMATPEFLKRQNARAQVGAHCAAVSCQIATPEQLGVSFGNVSDHCPQTVQAR